MISLICIGTLDKDGNLSTLKESEQNQLDEYFKSFQDTITNLITVAAKFVIVMKEAPRKEGTFSKVTSKQVKSFLEDYNDLISCVIDEVCIRKINNSYFAYIGLMRTVNTAIKNYNLEWPSYRFNYIKNIPEPSFQNGNLINYLAALKYNVNKNYLFGELEDFEVQ